MELVRVDIDDHIVLTCVSCGDERRFTQPPCADGHGVDCPEWACAECGAAVLIGPVPPARSAERARAAHRGTAAQGGPHGREGRERGAARIPA
ncbi:hypothetical protein [Frankia sp. AgKG'84/4]|uniref:hypothetical protein n=1 Tax=Frankia sp. AgKG'84/4 TaxID=573490 RepID=UPI002029F1F2|nr:hypothetical protein [Frankia sp. AgKG'84/4]MCL9797338.1 hypothetical protein [Frankia sp. AgKG'84/4]